MDELNKIINVEKGESFANQAIEIATLKNEQNLILYPFCSTTKADFFDSLEYVSEDKKYFLEVTPNAKYGMVKTWDFDILRFALSKIDTISSRTGHCPASVTFTAYEYLMFLGQSPRSGNNIKRLKQALDRLASTTYKGNIFKQDARTVAAFTLAKYEYKETSSGVIKISLSLDVRLLESLKNSNPLITVDRRVIGEPSGLKKRLLELVPLKLNYENEWLVSVIELQKLCANLWVLKRFKSEIKSFRDLPWAIAEKKIDGVSFLRFVVKTIDS